MIAGAAAACAVPWIVHAEPGPTIPPAQIDETLEIEGQALAARLAESRMSVSVSVNGRGPFRFAVDSGADRSVIGAAVAQSLALPAGEPVTLHSTTGTERVATVHIDRLLIGTSEIRAISAPALPERYLGAQGLLGIDALADQRLMLDFEHKRIVVQDTRKTSTPIDAEEIVVVARRRNGQLILTQASADGVGIAAIIDSGSEVTMGNNALRERLFARRRPPPATKVEIISVTGGVAVAESVAVPELRIGGVIAKGASIAFFEAPPFALFGLSRQPALLLGTDVLGGFSRVSLDFRARRVRFRLKA